MLISKLKNKQIILFFIALIFSYLPSVSSWYSRCEKSGKCYISHSKDSKDEVYLIPGQIRFITDKNTTPIDCSNDTSGNSFTLDLITGYSIDGPISGKFGYECAGGFSECANACCEKGYCSNTVNSCQVKRNDVKKVYIIMGSIFALFILLYWVVYFSLGYSYNKEVQTMKEKQKNGEKFEIQPSNYPKNQTDVIDSEIDDSGMQSQSIEINTEEMDEKEKCKKIRRVKIDDINNIIDEVPQSVYIPDFGKNQKEHSHSKSTKIRNSFQLQIIEDL